MHQGKRSPPETIGGMTRTEKDIWEKIDVRGPARVGRKKEPSDTARTINPVFVTTR